MSENVYSEPEIAKDGYRESMVDIYVSAESLRVYENPWVESVSPNISGLARPQHAGINSNRRQCTRADSVVYILLLAGILVVICLMVQMKKDKTNWRGERNQLQANITNLRKISEQLRANTTELSEEINDLVRKLCAKKKWKICKNLDHPDLD